MQNLIRVFSTFISKLLYLNFLSRVIFYIQSLQYYFYIINNIFIKDFKNIVLTKDMPKLIELKIHQIPPECYMI